MKCIFGIDVGGTSIKFGKFINGELVLSFDARTIIDPNDAVNSIINIITKAIDVNIGKDDELIGIGIAVPGPVNNGVVLGAENIYWGEVEIEKILREHYPNCEIVAINDANAATLGEWYYGSGNKKSNLVMVTLGTGIGGGIIINNKLYVGSLGAAGEIGHIRIFPFKGRPCSCGLSGCLEQYASATGIRRTAYGLRKGKDTVLNEKGRIGVRDIVDGAVAGDEVAISVIDKTAYYLAIGLAIIANTLNPDLILIGGGVSKSGDILLNPVKKYFKEMAFYSIKDTEIALATLYNKAGISHFYK